MKTILLLITLLTGAFMAGAQTTTRHQLSAGTGYATLDQVRKGLFRVTKEFRIPEDFEYINPDAAATVFGLDIQDIGRYGRKRSFTYMAGYHYRVLPWLSAGISAGYEQEIRQLGYAYVVREVILIGEHKRSVYTLSAELKPLYKQFRFVSLYGIVGVGNGFIRERTSSYSSDKTYTVKGNETAVQITPLGIAAGKKLKGFAEFGYGYKGMIHAGASYSF